MAQAQSNRLEGLDALRGIAALLVTVMHMQHIAGGPGMLTRAYLAVDLFFVLSGYVMARAYEAKFAAGLTAAGFLKARVKRLWPTMLAGALLGFAAFWQDMAPAAALAALLMAALFVPWLDPAQPTFPTNPPAWSILYELFANLIHGLWLRRLGTRALAGLMVASAVVLGGFAPHLDVGGGLDTVWLGLPRIIYSYCAGILLWRLTGERSLLPGWLGLALLPAGILALSAIPAGTAWPELAFVFLLCPAIVASGLSRLTFAVAPLTFLGRISFPLYAVHYPVAIIAAKAGLGVWGALPLVVAAAWVTAELAGRKWQWPQLRRPLPA